MQNENNVNLDSQNYSSFFIKQFSGALTMGGLGLLSFSSMTLLYLLFGYIMALCQLILGGTISGTDTSFTLVNEQYYKAHINNFYLSIILFFVAISIRMFSRWIRSEAFIETIENITGGGKRSD